MQIDLSCSQCGSNRFDYPILLKDDTVITCADCGHEVGTVADMQRRIVAALEARRASAA